MTDVGFDEYLGAVRTFTDEVLIPKELEMVDSGAVPPDVVEQMAALGLFGITLPRHLGGQGWSPEEQVRLTFEFTRASCVYRSRISTTIGLCSQLLLDYGTTEQRERYLPAMASGSCVTSFALTEEQAGSDASALRSTAERRGDHFLLNGTKRYITNAAWCDLLIVFARSPGSSGPHGLSAFLVPRYTPGVEVTLPRHMNGHAEGPVAEITFRDVRIPAAAVIGGEEGGGLRQALRGINHARLHVAATGVGQATRLLAEAAEHAVTRVQFGQPLSEIGAVEAMLGQSMVEIEAGRALATEAARRFGEPDSHHLVAAAKHYCSEMAGRVADRAVQILGGEGIVGDHPVPRMWRDVRALRIYEGASQIHERNLGRHVAEVARRRMVDPDRAVSSR